MKTVGKLAMAAALAAGPFVSHGMTLSVDQVRQRYPWNGIVDIDYTLQLEAGESVDALNDRLVVKVTDRAQSPAAVYLAQAISPLVPETSGGKHRLSWNANADGVDFVSSDVKVELSLLHYAAKYLVIDVSEGKDAASYPVEYLDGEPAGGFNIPLYKSDKIVFRLIPPGSFLMGSPTTEKNRSSSNESQHEVTLTRPFYIGIFETTQAQYQKVMGADPSKHKGETRPVEQVSYNNLRGEANATTHAYDWPRTNGVSEVSFFGKLRAKTGLDELDLPTEAQWEYACRAGTVGSFSTNEVAATDVQQTAQLTVLGRFQGNQNDQKGGFAEHTVVGNYQPNGWGLYDMHGNINELCLDYTNKNTNTPTDRFDPKGLETGTHRVSRGGYYSQSEGPCRSAARAWVGSASVVDYLGFRAAMTVR